MHSFARFSVRLYGNVCSTAGEFCVTRVKGRRWLIGIGLRSRRPASMLRLQPAYETLMWGYDTYMWGVQHLKLCHCDECFEHWKYQLLVKLLQLVSWQVAWGWSSDKNNRIELHWLAYFAKRPSSRGRFREVSTIGAQLNSPAPHNPGNGLPQTPNLVSNWLRRIAWSMVSNAAEMSTRIPVEC